MEPRIAFDLAEKVIVDANASGEQQFDEVALCFSDEAQLIHFVEQATEHGGLEHFNSVPHDTMKRQDYPGEFQVRFEFLRLPGANWRIEAMCVLGGHAPLHAEANQEYGSPCVVHLSYKCTGLQDYQEEVRRLLRSMQSDRFAEYTNSYGMFSYWRDRDQATHLPYLKPRVNLRD